MSSPGPPLLPLLPPPPSLPPGYAFFASTNPTTVFPDGCAERTPNDKDDITELQVAVNGCMLTPAVVFTPSSYGSYTTSNGISVALLYRAGSDTEWTRLSAYDFEPAELAIGSSNTYTGSGFAASQGEYYVRASLIDRASSSDTIAASATCCGGSPSCGSESGSHWDNADLHLTGLACGTPPFPPGMVPEPPPPSPPPSSPPSPSPSPPPSPPVPPSPPPPSPPPSFPPGYAVFASTNPTTLFADGCAYSTDDHDDITSLHHSNPGPSW